ncbi:UNVERIFIED_CONTAM: hypothetical protein GTU68_059794 [Idotea baltica]|nr:hypothetical protein [Idotea baltica]
MQDAIAVIDFGSQYTQLIVRRIRELGYFSKLYLPEELAKTGKPAAVILSGGPRSTLDDDAPDIDFEYLRGLGVPILGVCYGMQLLNRKFGGEVAPGNTREYGPAKLFTKSDSPLFEGITEESQIWMSHSDTCKMPDTATILGENQDGIPVGLQWAEDVYGIQFHPEVSHTDEGTQILGNFLKLAVDPPEFKIDSFKDELIAKVKEEFVQVFFDAVGEDIGMLAQGTLYPDVIESATSGSDASTIKTHHNRVDRIMELKAEGRILEPLDSLFKDEVRDLGRVLGLPEKVVGRHPFPGPGLAVRCPGEVTEEKLKIIQDADEIFINLLHEHEWYDKIWQAYAALIPTKTVGVKGDVRCYEYALSIRAVTSEDAMTAEWVHLPYELLGEISNRILNGVDGVNRVLYDISTKPPASIEWE